MNNIIDLLSSIEKIHKRKQNINNFVTSLSADNEDSKLIQLLKDIPNEITNSIYLTTLSKDAINNKNHYIYNYFSNEYQTIPGINNGIQYFSDLSRDQNLQNIKKYCGVWFTMSINWTIYYLNKKISKMRNQLWDDSFNPSIGFFKLKSDIPNMLLLNNDVNYNISALEEIIKEYNIDKSLIGSDYEILKNKYLSGTHQDTNYNYAAIICRIPQISGWINLQDSDEIFLKNPANYLQLDKKYKITKIIDNLTNITIERGKSISRSGFGFNDISNRIHLYENSNDISTIISDGKYLVQTKESELSKNNNIIIIHPKLFNEITYYTYNRNNLLLYMKSKMNNIDNNILTTLLDDDLFDKPRKEVDLNPEPDAVNLSLSLKYKLSKNTYEKLINDLATRYKLHELLVDVYIGDIIPRLITMKQSPHPQPQLQTTYGLYLVPDNETLKNNCQSISKGINWGGLHFTIASFTKGNKDKIKNVLDHIKKYGDKTKRWNLSDAQNTTPDKLIVKSKTLDNLRLYLKDKVDNIQNDQWHIYCKNGITKKTIDNSGTTWSLIMIERDGTNIKWINDTKIPFYDIHDLASLNRLQPIQLPRQMKVLSYNISWEAMSGKGSFGGKCGQIYPNTCNRNVAQFIENTGPYDFIGLQEATNWNEIRKMSLKLQQMSYVYNKPMEEMVTFYDNKYILDDGINIINSFMSDPGRPFTMIFFKQKLCVINVHPNHQGDIYKFDRYLIDTMKGNRTFIPKNSPTPVKSNTFQINGQSRGLTQSEETEVKSKLQTYDIILLGDFNDTLASGTVFLNDPYFGINGGRRFYGKNTVNTCCDNSLNGNVHSPFDHILSTTQNVNSQVHRVAMASDHLPITAIITK